VNPDAALPCAPVVDAIPATATLVALDHKDQIRLACERQHLCSGAEDESRIISNVSRLTFKRLRELNIEYWI
jgi:hypothetical protein